MRWEHCEAQAATEVAVMRMLALKRLARNLLETRKWSSMFVLLYQDHRHTTRARLYSCIEDTRGNTSRSIPGSRLTGQAFR